MYILNVEKRNETIKAKQLRKSGKVPVGVCGGDLQETMLLQVNKGDVAKLLRSKSKGGRVTMEMGGKKMSALLKEIDYDSFAGEV
ncbi:MAG: 50S ribosomal protein L25, partial [Oscillospiraceae bacterium]